MAAVVAGRTNIGIREIGSSTSVSTDPKARLMYYLNCTCVLLDMSDHPNITRLTNYSRYSSLTEEETDALIVLCVLLSPEELIDKVMFQDDAMCRGSANKFYELSAVRSTLLLSGTILVGGQSRTVTKIMAYKQQWLLDNWIIPMAAFTRRLERIARGGQPGARRSLEFNRSMRASIPARRSIAQTDYGSTIRLVGEGRKDDSCCCCTIL